MENSLVFAAAVFAVTSVAAPISKPRIALEAVVVHEVRQFANLMPVIEPDHKRAVRSKLEIEVLSNGCTRAEDFRVDVRRAAKRQILSLVRVKRDMCRAMARPVKIDFETERLALATQLPIQVANPILADVKVVH